jgi:hypothetical protein
MKNCLHCENELKMYYKSDEIPGLAHTHYIICAKCGNVMIAKYNEAGEITEIEQTPTDNTMATNLMIQQCQVLFEMDSRHSLPSEDRLVFVREPEVKEDIKKECVSCKEPICGDCENLEELMESGQVVNVEEVECPCCKAILEFPMLDEEALAVLQLLTDPSVISILNIIKNTAQLHVEMIEDQNVPSDIPVQCTFTK